MAHICVISINRDLNFLFFFRRGRDSEILNSLSDVCFSGIPDVFRPLDKKLIYSEVTLEEDVRLGNKCCVVRYFELNI